MADVTRDKSSPPGELLAAAKSAWPAFLAAHDALVIAVQERLSAANLPDLGWYDVLWALDKSDAGRLRMHELADAAVIARHNLTRLADRMEKAGLVARERVDGDRRGAYLTITDDGRAMRKSIWSIYGPAIKELFGGQLTAEENAMLRELMLKLLNNVRTGAGR